VWGWTASGHPTFPTLVGGYHAGPRNEHSKAQAPGPTEAYDVRYAARSALGSSNAARRS